MDHPMNDLITYPDNLPHQALTAIVVRGLRQQEVDAKECVHAGYHVGGFFLGKWDRHEGPVPMFAEEPFGSSDEEVAAFLETQLYNDSAQARNPLVWLLIAQAIMKLIDRLLNKDKEKQPCPGPGPCEQSS